MIAKSAAAALLTASLVVLAADPAGAARPDTRAMTCAAAQALVRQYGSVVMTTGPHTYARIVSGVGFCPRGEETQLVTAPTRDQPRCRVGNVCRPAVLFEDFLRR